MSLVATRKMYVLTQPRVAKTVKPTPIVTPTSNGSKSVTAKTTLLTIMGAMNSNSDRKTAPPLVPGSNQMGNLLLFSAGELLPLSAFNDVVDGFNVAVEWYCCCFDCWSAALGNCCGGVVVFDDNDGETAERGCTTEKECTVVATHKKLSNESSRFILLCTRICYTSSVVLSSSLILLLGRFG